MEAPAGESATEDRFASHPAVLDAERLVRDADRSLRRGAPPLRRPTAILPRRIAGAVAFCGFAALGWVIAVRAGALPADAVARVQAAQAVLAGRDPHLEALGFVWGPLPSVFEVPLTGLRHLWPAVTGNGIAAVIVSAFFMAGVVVQLLRWGAEAGAGPAMRLVVVAVTVAHPLLWLYGSNGMSEACWLFFLVLAGRRLALWAETDSLEHLVVTGCALAGAYLVRYETVGVVVAVACYVGVLTFRRWHPEVDDPGRRVAEWPEDRDRLRRALLDVVIVTMPPVAAVVGWSLASWVIVGEWLPQLSSRYGNAALVEAAGDLSGLVPDTSGVGRLWFFVLQVSAAVPGLVALVAVALATRKVAAGRVAAACAVLGTPLVVQACLSARGTTFPWFRYSIAAVVLAAMVALSVGRAAHGLRVVAVVLLLPGIVLGLGVIREARLGSAGDTATLDGLQAVLGGHEPHGGSLLGLGRQVAEEIDRLGDAEAGSVICDAASCFAVLLNAPRPELYVIPSDRDFEPLAADPQQFGVRYVLLTDPAASPSDALLANFPGLWSGSGPPEVELVREWGDERDPSSHRRLFRIHAPLGDPPARPAEVPGG